MNTPLSPSLRKKPPKTTERGSMSFTPCPLGLGLSQLMKREVGIGPDGNSIMVYGQTQQVTLSEVVRLAVTTSLKVERDILTMTSLSGWVLPKQDC